MMFFDIILFFLPHILQPPFGNRINSKALAQKEVSLIFLIVDNSPDSAVSPLNLPFFVFPAKSGQPMFPPKGRRQSVKSAWKKKRRKRRIRKRAERKAAGKRKPVKIKRKAGNENEKEDMEGSGRNRCSSSGSRYRHSHLQGKALRKA